MNRAKILAEVGQMISTDRNKTHGDPQTNLSIAQQLRDVLERGPMWRQLLLSEREALGQIMTKASRLVSGQPDLDHWKDIAGYAAIGAEARSREKTWEAHSKDHENEMPPTRTVKVTAYRGHTVPKRGR